ncbi:MAG: SusC/RagA family TonB-linked outer membrane protein [Candidatus Cryptobacteroides sp.]
MKRPFVFILISLLSLQIAMAQGNVRVRGTVTANDGEPLPGVVVSVKNIYTETNSEGAYNLEVPEGSTLSFFLQGMKTEFLTVEKSGQYDIRMEEESLELEESVVVGYGTQRKKDLTGSITVVSGESIKNAPSNNPLSTLQGKVPGLYVINSGAADGTPTITLRGVSTVRASTTPLFVVDNMLTDNISWLNVNDIETMEVLKDASSTAMFGVQGANGVIIITTKKAEEEGTRVSYSGNIGVNVVHDRDRLKLCDADDFTLLYNELLKNMDPDAETWVPDLTGKGTDWIDLVLRPAIYTNHNITLAKGGKHGSSTTSLSFLHNEGVVKFNSYDNFNVRTNNEYKIGNWLKAGIQANVRMRKSDPANVSLSSVARVIPTYDPWDSEDYWDENNLGSYFTPADNIQKDVGNPIAAMYIGRGNSNNRSYQGLLNGFLEITFLKDFTFKAAGYADYSYSIGDSYTPKYYVTNGGSASSQYSRYTSFSRSTSLSKKHQADLTLTYHKVTDKVRLNVLAGFTAKEYEGSGFSASADSLINGSHWNIAEDMRMLNLGDPISKKNSDWYSSNAFLSYLGRVNLTVLDRYLLTATIRYDGSSKFGKNNRWGLFPSVGLGWVISDEKFMKNAKAINFWKLRTSFGQAGNDKIGDYLAYPTINPKGTTITSGGETYYLPVTSYQVDQNIHWEVVSTFDVGTDLKMFNNRLGIELGYYYKKTSDLLAHVAPTISVGSGYAVTNAGSLCNQGVEYLVSWEDRIGDFGYNVSINSSTVKNRVLSLGNDDSYITSGSYHRTAVGYPVGSFYGYVADGIFQNQQEVDEWSAAHKSSYIFKPGDIRYKDLNEDGKFDDKDRDFIGKTIPSFMYGINIKLSYKNFDFTCEMNGVQGVEILNTKFWQTYAQYNYYKVQLNRWHGEGTSNSMPILDSTRPQNQLCSTNAIEDGSYFRIRNLQLGYTLPKKALNAIRMHNLYVYIQAQNPLTFKHTTSYSPEIGGSILSANIDDGGSFPIPTSYTFGINLTF